jgi:hypothetical protein
MRYLLSCFAGLALAAALTPATAHADPYRWCADFSGRGGSTSCYYTSFERCRVELIGRGGICRPNLFFDGRPVMTEERRAFRSRAQRY